MRTKSPMLIARGLLMLLLLSLCLAGCTTNRDKVWDSRVGTYTVRQAVHDLGRPDEAFFFQDHNQVGKWMIRFGTEGSLRYHWGPTFSARVFDCAILPREAPHVPNEYLRLLFGPDGKLVAWDRMYD